MRYPLVESTWGAAEREAVIAVVDSGKLTSGPKVREFEQAFAKRVGSRHAVLVNSGSSANLIAVAAIFYHSKFQFTRGEEAIVPAIAWSTTYSPLHQYGLKLRLVDVELGTLNMDITKLKAALTLHTRVLVGVSILGNPAALDEMREFADEHHLVFLEDNCESMGAVLNGKQAGTFGHVGTYSMFFSHHLNTIEGGVLVTDDSELYQIALCLREHGWSRGLVPDGGFYNFRFPGYNVRPTEITAAVGLVQLGKLEEQLAARRANALKFRSLFEGDKRFVTQRENGESSWFAFTMIAKEGRASFISKMGLAGVDHRMITGGCFSLHPACTHYDYRKVGSLVNAELAHRNGFFVGNFGRDLSEELTHLKETLE